jgi:hypothetical protein
MLRNYRIALMFEVAVLLTKGVIAMVVLYALI